MVHASLIRQMYPQCLDSGKIEDRNLRIYVMTNMKDKAWLVLIFLAMVMGLLLFLPGDGSILAGVGFSGCPFLGHRR
jgi:hypothetical protein